ncbi:TRAP-type mannitol/chloroaromatic compound transport system permease small subunit [Halomonas fontilapidosi]|uniref:TRAP transporter small permease protein n=1 Tax=Halomonas fontilapidosi TaxID=616675 RepID=A0A7W5GZM1_9GAMM|nr:TRAP transporter small permease subunit [Halomonas fontilapidosi]MBB3184427.1 TRAP-type mannitol/chloroaromatic compound transport system permease small subunit [Halomonas fontilapidosi]
MAQSRELPGFLAWLDRASEWLGRSLSWLILAMMLVQFLIVVLRYAFSFNSIPMQESVMYMHATVFMLAAAWTLKHDGHVRVDIFYRAMTPKRKALVDLCGTLFLLLPVMVFVILTSMGYVSKSWRIFEGSPDSGGIPGVFLLKTLIPLFAGLMILQALVEASRHFLVLTGRMDPTDNAHDHAEERL